MATVDNRYSRFVQYTKIALPLLALALLSTLFLFSRTLDPSQAIPFADIDVEKIAREQRLASPKFSGVTSDGSAISVVAESAKPDPNDPRRLSAEKVNATIEATSGTRYEISAEQAAFDGNIDTLELMGGVMVETSTGYQLTTSKLTTNLKTTGLTASGRVNGTGPTGTLEAGRMELIPQNGSQVLVFKDGVKLVYQRQR